MDQKHLNTLEFPRILENLARHTSFSAGRDLALALVPSPVVSEVRYRLRETGEARYLLDEQGGVSMGGVHDVRRLAENAVRGAILQPADLLDIHSTIRVGRRVHRVLTRLSGRVPRLADIAARIEPCEGLMDDIGRCISEQGEVVDHASPKLARIRREMRTAHERLLDKLNRIISRSSNASYLQEVLITTRGGRYVIPIKAEFRGRIPGVVHDSSASGATLFIEPLPVVELGNRWRERQIDERKEVDRILAELSALVADLAEELAWSVQALAELDLAFAKGRYANTLEGSEPRLVLFGDEASQSGRSTWEQALAPHTGLALDLRQARHPLLDPQTVVPTDLYLDEGYYALVITGPNTGGKTVSLKTSLSTFSSHLTNIVDILAQANDRSLVLLDELGAGTDPVEGSALARAILSHLLERRITTLVATHYSELKAYAHTMPGVENASLKFDLETLSPTYQLQIGLPGRSNAFAIAQRLGLNSEIVQGAQALVSPDELETESLLAEIQAAHREAVLARDEAQATQQQLAEQEHRLSARLAAIEGERAAILGESRAEARRELAEVRREVEALQTAMTDQQRQSTLTEEWLAQARARLAEVEQEVSEPIPSPLPEEKRLSGKILLGDTVWIAGLNTTGKVTALDGNSVEVQVGSFGVRVNLSALERRAQAKAEKPFEPVVMTQRSRSVDVELDLRGRRVEEILPRLEKYLDDAFLAGLPFVHIIHGKGTGALRHAVRQQLQDHPLVKSHRSGKEGEGGTGVTVAYLVGD